MVKFLKFARCSALKRLTFRLIELSARVASSILIDIVQISAENQWKYKSKKRSKSIDDNWTNTEMNWMTHPLVSKTLNAVNETGNCTQLPRTFCVKVIDATLMWQIWICDKFSVLLSCDKQAHVNFWSTYFQQDANRWQTFSLRRVREPPERLCSLPPLKQPQVPTKRAGYCHQCWKGTILKKYVCYTSYTRVYDPYKILCFCLSFFSKKTDRQELQEMDTCRALGTINVS